MGKFFLLAFLIASTICGQENSSLDTAILNSPEYNDYVSTVYRFAMLSKTGTLTDSKELNHYDLQWRTTNWNRAVNRRKILADSLNMAMEKGKEKLFQKFPGLQKEPLNNKFLMQMYSQIGDSIRYYYLKRQ